MDDDKKTKVQLIEELELLRQKFNTLEQEQRVKSRAEAEKAELEHFFRERVKELSCLYGMAELIEKNKNSFDNILQGVVDLIPPSWQYPKITAARIIYDETKFVSKGFKSSQWKQSADISVYNKRHGSVEVFYLEKCPDSFEGPFLKEERLLINAISERIGRVAERIRTEQELKAQYNFLNNLVESFPNPLYVVGVNDYKIKMSNSIARKRGAVEGGACYQATHGAKEPCVSAEHPCPLEEINKTHKPVVVEHLHEDKGGKQVWYEVHGYPVFDEKGSLDQMIKYSIDISQRKQNELERENLVIKLNEIISEKEQRQNEVNVLLECAREVMKNGSFEEAARTVFDICRKATSSSSGYVALLSEDGSENEVLFLESGGLPFSVDKDLPMPIRGLRSESYRTGKSVYENDFMSSEWIKYMPAGHVRLKNVMFSPLIIEEKPVGLIGLANKKDDYNDDDARLASGLAEIASVSLQKNQTLDRLMEALENVKVLKGLIPICSTCKKIRDDKGFWNNVEKYIQTHSEAEFTHGICPECAESFINKIDEDE